MTGREIGRLMKIFIVGKLGEVVKKVCELEEVIKENADTSILITELASYQEILKCWPVEDENQVHIAIQVFKMSLASLKQKEQDLITYLNNIYPHHLQMAVAAYVSALNNVREHLQAINELGRFIGSSPWMELEDDNLEQTTD